MRPDIDSISRLTDIYFSKTKETVRRFGDKSDDRAWVRRESEQFYGSYYSIRPNP